MFRKTYDSLSMPVHVEVLIADDKICLKTYLEATKGEYENVKTNSSAFKDAWKYNFLGPKNTSATDMDELKNDERLVERSLTQQVTPKIGEFPPEVKGVYHRYLPCGKLMGQYVMGEEFLANMPEPYKSDYKDKLTGRHFIGNSYAWIDLTDPSIGNGEKSDAACWVIGVDYDGFASPAFNSIAREGSTKAHPLRSARQYGAPTSLFVYQPFADTPLDECSITLKYNKGHGFSTNIMSNWADGTTEQEIFKKSGTDEKGNKYNYLGHLNEAFPNFTLTKGGGKIDADGTDTVEFKMVDSSGKKISKNVQLYLESTGGYLPKQRVTTDKGVGSFKVKALGMDSGDQFKVKIGFRNFTGVIDVDYSVN